MEIKSLLWPTDLSENAKKALSFLRSISEKYDTEIHILYVQDNIGPFGSWYGEFEHSEIDKIRELDRKKAEESLDKICEDYLSGCPYFKRHTATGDPASEILKFIDKYKPDMVVMSKIGEKGHFDVGNVTGRVIRHSKVPILIIPA